MKGLMIAGCVLLALWLLSFVRVGGAVAYGETGLTARVRLGPFWITLYPMKKRKKKKDKPPRVKKEKKKPPEQEKRPPGAGGGSLELVREFLPLIADAAGRFRRRILIEGIGLFLTWGAEDPAACAMGFGYANAAIGMIWPLIENNFSVRERDIQTAVDFGLKRPLIRIDAALSITIGQAASLGLLLGLRALHIYRTHKKATKAEKAV